MSEFRIEFVEEADDDGERAGRIVIGDFEEGFIATTEFWDADTYRRQWLDGARRFAGGADRSCFVTQAEEDFLEWWKVYRIDGRAVFRNQHVALEDGAGYDRLYERIPDYALLGEDGLGVSEWILDETAFEGFVRAHAG